MAYYFSGHFVYFLENRTERKAGKAENYRLSYRSFICIVSKILRFQSASSTFENDICESAGLLQVREKRKLNEAFMHVASIGAQADGDFE